jgi:GNAT superfamily N-acetyltransferase
MESARPARADELHRVSELAQQARRELVTERGGPLLVAHDLGAVPEMMVGSSVLVGCIEDVIVGYGLVRVEQLRDGSRLGVLDEIYVEPEARAVGVGEALITEVFDLCRREGCRGVDARALPGMRATKNFFETFGLVARSILVHRSLEDE